MQKETLKLKIAHVVCVVPPYGGGIGQAAHQLADMSCQFGHQVTVFSPKKSFDPDYKREYFLSELKPLVALGNAAVMPSLIWKLKNFQVVILHYPFFGSAFFVYLVKFFHKNLKLIVYYHQDLVMSGWRQKYYRLSLKFFVPALLKQCSKILVSTKDYIAHSDIKNIYRQQEQKFVELPFSVSKRFQPEPKNTSLLTKFKISPQDIVLLFVGGLDAPHYFKGIKYLLEALSFIPELHIKALIVGKGKLQREYENLSNQLNIQDKVIFTGYVSDKELPNYYNLADIFVLPSINKNEAFGIVLLEAMACAKPLLASALYGVRQVVRDQEGGLLFNPKDSRDLAQKIKILSLNKQLRQEFGKNNLQEVRQKYTFEKVASGLETFLNNL